MSNATWQIVSKKEPHWETVSERVRAGDIRAVGHSRIGTPARNHLPVARENRNRRVRRPTPEIHVPGRIKNMWTDQPTRRK